MLAWLLDETDIAAPLDPRDVNLGQVLSLRFETKIFFEIVL